MLIRGKNIKIGRVLVGADFCRAVQFWEYGNVEGLFVHPFEIAVNDIIVREYPDIGVNRKRLGVLGFF